MTSPVVDLSYMYRHQFTYRKTYSKFVVSFTNANNLTDSGITIEVALCGVFDMDMNAKVSGRYVYCDKISTNMSLRESVSSIQLFYSVFRLSSI